MGEKKHIDRLFQENFKDFEVKPDDAVWKNIEAKLNKKKKRRVVPIWWRYAGVAALLLLMLTIGSIYINNNDGNNVPQVVDTENTDNEKSNEKLQQRQDLKKDNSSVIANTKEDNSVSDKTSDTSKEDIVKDQLAEVPSSNTIASSKEEKTKNNKKTINGKNASMNNNPSKGAFTTTSVEQVAENLNTTSKEKPSETDKIGVPEKANLSKTDIADNNIKKEISNSLKDGISKTDVADNNTKEDTKTIEDAVKENENLLKAEDVKVAYNKWSVAPNAAPVYFNTLGKGSSIAEQFNSNSKSGEVNMSYGINASYAITNRLTVRSGINRVNLGYNTNDVVAFNSVNASASPSTLAALSGSVSQNTPENMLAAGEDVTIMSAATFKSSNIDVLKATTTSINQSFGFIEVPLELQYALSTKRFGVNVIGGFSSLFLNDYEAFSVIEGERTSVQNNENVNNTSYSANFGLGLNYKISDKINLNLEPMFKYQINMFKNTSGDFQPFFVGVYTGFGIKF